MELRAKAHLRGGGFTDDLLILDDEGELETELREAAPTMAAMLKLAIGDVDDFVEEHGEAAVDGEIWKEKQTHLGMDGVCRRCMAGAMLMRLDVPEGDGVNFVTDRGMVVEVESPEGKAIFIEEIDTGEAGMPEPGTTAARLWAVEKLRTGNITGAAKLFYGKHDDTNGRTRANALYEAEPEVGHKAAAARHLRMWSRDRQAYVELAERLEQAHL